MASRAMEFAISAENREAFAGIPRALFDGVVAEAEADAERVVLFFKYFRRAYIQAHGDPEAADCLLRHFTEEQLLDLGALLRIMVWQSQGLVTPEMKLPAVTDDMLKGTLLMMFRAGAKSAYTMPLLTAFVKHFAWSGRSELGASVTLDHLPEDDFVEQLAKFMWNHRNQLQD